MVGDLYVTASHLTWHSSRRFAVDLILLLAVIAARFTAPASRTREQLKWFLTPEVGGVCLFIALGHFAIYQSGTGALLMAIELSFWFCVARVCKLSWHTMERIWGFALLFFYAVHRLLGAYVKTRIDWERTAGRRAGDCRVYADGVRHSVVVCRQG